MHRNKSDIPLRSVYTFPFEVVHLSPRVPVAVRRLHCAPADPEIRSDFTGRLDAGTRCITDYDVRPEILPHDHSFYEVVFVCGGSATHVTDEELRPLVRGSVLVVPPGVVHGYSQMQDLVKINLYYIAEWLAADLADLWRRHDLLHLFLSRALFGPAHAVTATALELADGELDRCVHELGDIAEQGRSATPNTMYLRACLVKILATLCEAYSRGPSGYRPGTLRGDVLMVLDEVERSLQNSRPLEVAALAVRCGCTPEHLTRVFRSAVGFSVMQYYQRRRMHLASRMLLQSDSSMTGIAHELGFADFSHFRRTFRRHYGVAPVEYRRRRGVIAEPPDSPH